MSEAEKQVNFGDQNLPIKKYRTLIFIILYWRLLPAWRKDDINPSLMFAVLKKTLSGKSTLKTSRNTYFFLLA